MFSTSRELSDLGEDCVGCGVFLDLETALFGDGIFLGDGAEGDDAGWAFGERCGALVCAGGKAAEAFVGAFGNSDVEGEGGGFVGPRESGEESAKAG
jgi:hypothetical protein